MAEHRARSRLRRSFVITVLLACIGGAAWFVTSSHMSVDSLVVSGVKRSGAEGILAAHRIVQGKPLVAIRVSEVERDLMADPWIEAASVRLVFPTRVEVHVQERVDVAWTQVGARWGLLADDAVLLEYADAPTSVRPLIRIQSADPGLGGRVESHDVSGSIEFLDALPDYVAERTIVQMDGREIWVWVGYRAVRLGLPVDMASKAASLMAIIDAAPEGVIDVTAPSRPAVRPGHEVGATMLGAAQP